MKTDYIIHGDCVEVMKKIPSDSIDLIFADPPYYLQLPKGKRLKRADGSEIIPVDNNWDQFNGYEDYDNFTQNWIKECQRILKPTGTFWVIGMYHNIFRVGTIMQNLGFWFLKLGWLFRGSCKLRVLNANLPYFTRDDGLVVRKSLDPFRTFAARNGARPFPR